jgi:ubiquinone/menaquinone biosynthesis C-methylase UbiE
VTSLFDPLVEFYDAARPEYPDAHFDALADLTQPLDGARVVEVGAGTGIATRALRRRGALVLPVDHGAAMLRRLQERGAALATERVQPSAVQGDAHALPVRSGWADLVCYAQAWHWTDPQRACAEAERVLRAGGALAVWWNLVRPEGLDWLDRQHGRIEEANPGWGRGEHHNRPWVAEFNALGWSVQTAITSWVRTLALEEYMVWMHSKSYVAAIAKLHGSAALEEFMAAERASLLEAFPDGQIVEPFVTELYVVRPPAALSVEGD